MASLPPSLKIANILPAGGATESLEMLIRKKNAVAGIIQYNSLPSIFAEGEARIYPIE